MNEIVIILTFILFFSLLFILTDKRDRDYFQVDPSENSYDVVFTITMHEQPEACMMLLENIWNATKELKIAILLHTNVAMYEPMKSLLKYKNWPVWVHPRPFQKGWAEYGILEGHLENVRYFNKELKKTTKYYCLLASNCMLHTKMTLDMIDKAMDSRSPGVTNLNPGWMWHNPLQSNTYILEKLDKAPMVVTYHEGTVYESEFLNEAAEEILNWDVKPHIQAQLPFEEYVLQSLYAKKTGYSPVRICDLHNQPNIDRVDQVQSLPNICLKPVPRNPDHPVRKYLATKEFFRI